MGSIAPARLRFVAHCALADAGVVCQAAAVSGGDGGVRHGPLLGTRAALREGLIAIMETLRSLERKLEGIDRQMVAAGRADATCRHLITAPGYGPILSSAMAALVIDPGAFKRSSDFAASLGLVPRQDGTGGKVRLGPISKRGNGYLRRLLVNGATSLIKSQHARRDPWVAKLLASKPRKVVAVALANKLARIGWALMRRQENFRSRPAAA